MSCLEWEKKPIEIRHVFETFQNRNIFLFLPLSITLLGSLVIQAPLIQLQGMN